MKETIVQLKKEIACILENVHLEDFHSEYFIRFRVGDVLRIEFDHGYLKIMSSSMHSAIFTRYTNAEPELGIVVHITDQYCNSGELYDELDGDINSRDESKYSSIEYRQCTASNVVDDPVIHRLYVCIKGMCSSNGLFISRGDICSISLVTKCYNGVPTTLISIDDVINTGTRLYTRDYKTCSIERGTLILLDNMTCNSYINILKNSFVPLNPNTCDIFYDSEKFKNHYFTQPSYVNDKVSIGSFQMLVKSGTVSYAMKISTDYNAINSEMMSYSGEMYKQNDGEIIDRLSASSLDTLFAEFRNLINKKEGCDIIENDENIE